MKKFFNKIAIVSVLALTSLTNTKPLSAQVVEGSLIFGPGIGQSFGTFAAWASQCLGHATGELAMVEYLGAEYSLVRSGTMVEGAANVLRLGNGSTIVGSGALQTATGVATAEGVAAASATTVAGVVAAGVAVGTSLAAVVYIATNPEAEEEVKENGFEGLGTALGWFAEDSWEGAKHLFTLGSWDLAVD